MNSTNTTCPNKSHHVPEPFTLPETIALETVLSISLIVCLMVLYRIMKEIKKRNQNSLGDVIL